MLVSSNFFQKFSIQNQMKIIIIYILCYHIQDHLQSSKMIFFILILIYLSNYLDIFS